MNGTLVVDLCWRKERMKCEQCKKELFESANKEMNDAYENLIEDMKTASWRLDTIAKHLEEIHNIVKKEVQDNDNT